MLRGMLNLRNEVTITRITETSDGLGGLSVSSAITTLARANIWQVSGGDRSLSDKITKSSTHVLALEYGAYSFTDADRYVNYAGAQYKLTGHYDDIANRKELLLAGLTWQS
jgi:hypothetical protein